VGWPYNRCIQLTADQRAFNIFSVSFCEVICNQPHQAAATDAGRYVFKIEIRVAIFCFEVIDEGKKNQRTANFDSNQDHCHTGPLFRM